VTHDRPLYRDIAEVARLVDGQTIRREIESAVGPLS